MWVGVGVRARVGNHRVSWGGGSHWGGRGEGGEETRGEGSVRGVRLTG